MKFFKKKTLVKKVKKLGNKAVLKRICSNCLNQNLAKNLFYHFFKVSVLC